MATAEKMRAAEKLLSLLSQRKKAIIEHVRQQTESYSQLLASKLLIEGINPPSWLQDPSNSGLRELNEEDLICTHLSQYCPPSARYPGHNHVVIARDHEKFSDGEVVEIPAPNEDLYRKNDAAPPGFSSENHGECALVSELDASAASPDDQTDRILDNCIVSGQSLAETQRSKSRQKARKLEVVEIPAPNEDLDRKNDPAAPGFSSANLGAHNSVPELDASAASPEDQTDRILDNYIVSDQLLAGIQRSKSRQKALELRSSAKAPAKSCLRHESTIDVVSSQIRFSLSITNQTGQNDELPHMEEPFIIDTQRSEKRNVVEAHCSSREVGVAALSESRSDAEVPLSVVGSFPLGFTSEDYQENGSSQDARVKSKEFIPLSDTEHADNHVKSPKSAGPSAVCHESFRDRAEEDADFLCEDEVENVYTGEITRSEISCRRQSCGYDSTKAGTSFDDCEGIDIAMKLTQLEEPYSERSEKRNVVEAHCLSREVDAEVPISVVGSFPLGCPSEDYQENGSSQDARVKSKESIPLSDTEHADNHVKSPKSAGPSSDRCENFRDRAEEDANFHTRSEISCRRQSCGYDSTKAGTSFDDCDGIDITMKLNQLEEPYSERSEKRNVVEAYCLSREVGVAALSESRSETYAEIPISVVGSFPLGCPSEDYQENGSSQDARVKSREFTPLSDTEHSNNHVKSPKSAGLSIVCCQSFRDRAEEDVNFLTQALSAKAPAKSCLRHESTSDIGSSQSRFSLSITDQAGQTDELTQLEEPCINDSQRSENRNVVEAHCLSREVGVAALSESKSETYGEVPISVLGSFPLGCSSEDYQENASSQDARVKSKESIPLSDTEHADNHVKSPKSSGPSAVCSQSIRDGLQSSSVKCVEQENFDDEASDEDQLVSSAPESNNSMLSYGQNSAKDPAAKSNDCSIKKSGINSIAINEIKQYPAQRSQILLWPESEVCSRHGVSSLGNNFLGRPSTIRLDNKNSSLERRLRNVRIESWPQVKRRKIEPQQAHCFASSQSFRVTKPHTFQRDPDITSPKTMEIDIETGLMVHAETSTDDGICSEENTNLMEGIQSTILSQHGEVGSSYIEMNEHTHKPPVINDEQLVATISSLAMKESRNSQGCFIDGTRTSPSSCDYLDARMSGDEQCRQNLCNLKTDTENLSSESLDLSSTLHEDLHLTDEVDQSMPVFEGFMVNAETATDELDFAADGFDLGKLELPRMTLERASILAEICRSASLDRLSSHFSSAFKFEDTGNLCKSLSDDGHLEHLEFGNNYPSDVGINFQSCSSSSDGYTDTLDGMPYSVSLAYSGERYGWDSRNQPPSPVGKLWNQLSSHKGSSGKSSSSNPEFICFPIEEDPSSSEENKTTEENAGDIQDETDSSLANHCDRRQPLNDLTNVSTNPPMSVSAEEETSRTDSVDFLKSKFSVTGTQEKVLLGHKYQSRKSSETSEKQTSCTRAADGRKHQLSSIGRKAIKRAKESVNNSISKPIVSNKTSLKGRDQQLSLREPRRNNIVSHVSSFIPLIQQKQAAAACQGKRDVKVKALEAAEAAKRLEEQKEIERKKRKEALKLERAKLEERNLKHMELEKKRKEEESKKKDAEMITKKRLREELEKKEKEIKRMRLESRQRQREQEEKKRVMRPEKENQRTKDDQMNRKNEFNKESKRKQNRETTRGEGAALQKTDNNLTINEVVVNYEECGTSGLSCDGEGMHATDKSPRNEDLIVQNSKAKSYEISPYKCSDDEDEEDDELPTKKYIPSWASKSAVALFLPLQRELDPDVIFPLKSFCSKDEVLLPRSKPQ